MTYNTVSRTIVYKSLLLDFLFVSNLTTLFCFLWPWLGKQNNMVGTAEGFSILRFLKPGINSIFGLKQSGVKCALHTYVFARSREFSPRKFRSQTLLSGPFDNL